MKQRGKRIRPSGKDLVFHFTIASLLPVFLLVVGLFHVKTIQQINWQDFNLSQACWLGSWCACIGQRGGGLCGRMSPQRLLDLLQ